MEDHIHLFVSLHPTIALSDFIKDIKISSNYWMRANGNFISFQSWGKKYAAFTSGNRDKTRIINYIKNQKEHHKKESFQEEIKRIFAEEGLILEDDFFVD